MNIGSSRAAAVVGAALLAAAFVSPVRAALIEVDLNTAGDKLITRDTAQGLDFLDVNLTLNLSYNEIVAGAGGWAALGFRHATLAEVEALYHAVGLTGVFDGSTASPSNHAPGMNLIRMAGCTFGCFADPGNHDQSGIADDPGSPTIGVGDVRLTDTLGFARATVFLKNSRTLDKDFKSAEVGHYLVRAAPLSVAEPAPLAVLAVGLLAAGLARRRTKRPAR